jgi:hypothetical protein
VQLLSSLTWHQLTLCTATTCFREVIAFFFNVWVFIGIGVATVLHSDINLKQWAWFNVENFKAASVYIRELYEVMYHCF